MFRERAKTLQGLSLVIDVAIICVAFGIAFVLRAIHPNIPFLGNIPGDAWNAETIVRSDYALLLGLSVIAWVVALRTSGVYLSHRSESFSTILWTYLRAMSLAIAATGAATFIFRMSGISRIFFGYYFSAAALLLLIKQAVVIHVLRSIRETGFNRRHALVIGSGQPASSFARVVLEATRSGYNLVGLLLTSKVMSAETTAVPVVGTLNDLDDVLTKYPVDEVFVVGGAKELAALAPTAQELIERGRIVSLVTPTVGGGTHGVRGRVTDFDGVPMISFGPMPHDTVDLGLKRMTDIFVSSVAFVALLPVMAVTALAVKLCDPGPILFCQERLGLNGNRFKLYKFRSMRVDAEERLKSDPVLLRRYIDNDYKLPEPEDPRISPLGRFLRKSSLDELPQLINVLMGDMSLVGPRPIVPAEIENYRPYEVVLLSARPGLTGHWQVSGRSDVRYPERAYMDLDYIGLNSILSDLGILARTVPAVLRRKGAH